MLIEMVQLVELWILTRTQDQLFYYLNTYKIALHVKDVLASFPP